MSELKRKYVEVIDLTNSPQETKRSVCPIDLTSPEINLISVEDDDNSSVKEMEPWDLNTLYERGYQEALLETKMYGNPFQSPTSPFYSIEAITSLVTGVTPTTVSSNLTTPESEGRGCCRFVDKKGLRCNKLLTLSRNGRKFYCSMRINSAGQIILIL